MSTPQRSLACRARSGARQRGLTTVEYVVLLVLIAGVGIASWRIFGEKVRKSAELAGQQLDTLDTLSSSGPAGAVGPGGASGPATGAPAGQVTVVNPGPTPPQPSGSGGSGSSRSSPSASTGLGASADAIVSKSPSLTQDVQTLRNQGWTFRYGTAGGGTYTDVDTKTIVLDANEQANPAEVANSISHEAGHALTPTANVTPSGLTRAEYIKKNTDAELLGEAVATLNNARARDEILSNGGPDIGIAGAQPKKYEAIYKQYKSGKLTQAQAEQQIAKAYGAGETTSNTNQNYQTYYSQFYAQAWDAQYPKKPITFRAP